MSGRKMALFVYNAFSGDRSLPEKLDYVISYFQERDIWIQFFRIEYDFEEKLLWLISKSNFDMLIVSGGDGTLNIVANILLKNKIELPIGLIPTGTCNDFARCLTLSNVLEEEMEIIVNGKTRLVDVGLINGNQYFLSSFAGGLFAGVSYETDSSLKETFGPFAYYITALSEFLNIKPFNLKVKTDNKVFCEEAILYVILNGKNVGGFSNLTSDSLIDDGFMEIVIIKSCQTVDLPGIIIKVLNNDLVNDKNVLILRTNHCEIEIDRKDIALTIDGEKGEEFPDNISIVHKGLRFFVP